MQNTLLIPAKTGIGSGNRNLPKVDMLDCVGCGSCADACHSKSITLRDMGHWRYAYLGQPNDCDLCGACVEACPQFAIELS